MKISKDVQAQARRLMRLCIGPDGQLLEDNVRQIADTLTEEKPRNYIPLLAAFTELVKLQVRRNTATVTSALPLSDSEKALITAKLTARRPGISCEWVIDPSIIAGLTVKVADDVTDASVKSRIERLSKI